VSNGNIFVEQAAQPALGERLVEMCEHKGVGHPDSLTDGACEAAAVALAAAYVEAFGTVQHFNVDKGLLIAGRSEPRFGGGRVLASAKLIVCGRAADRDGRVNAPAVAVQAARDYLRRTLRRGADTIEVEAAIRAGAANLERLYGDDPRAQRANDTSFGVGFAPFSRLERAVLDQAAALRSNAFHERFPAAGDDFKIMGVRHAERLQFTVALALVDCEVASAARYREIKHAIAEHLSACVPAGASVVVNALDDPQATTESGLYLTVSGLSAEMGDDGQVGRGNRLNGLITPGRAMSLEAAAGKNPLGHVGKIYNVLAGALAREICEALPEVCEASVQLVSQIGRPICEPSACFIEIIAKDGITESLRERIRGIARSMLERSAPRGPFTTLGQ
jgi:S-adenosylmethionine synthetase